MWLQSGSGTWVQVTKVVHETKKQRVHNFTVDGQHDYFIFAGAASVLVHNDACPPVDPEHGLQMASDAAGEFANPGGMTGALYLPGRAKPTPLSSGRANLHPNYLENLPPGTNNTNYHHLEAQAAGAMRKTGAERAHLFISGDYICGACVDRLAKMLPGGKTLTVWFRDSKGIQNRSFTGSPD